MKNVKSKHLKFMLRQGRWKCYSNFGRAFEMSLLKSFFLNRCGEFIVFPKSWSASRRHYRSNII